VRKLSNKHEDAMIKHIQKIVYEEHRPVSYFDFIQFKVDGETYNLASGTIRNKFSKLRREKKIESCNFHTNPAYYTLPGIRFGKDRLMTLNHKEDNNNNTIIHHTHLINHPIYKILEETALDERAIHNIHLKYKVSKLYELLSTTTSTTNPLLTKDPVNKGITITHYDIDKFTIIITINKNDTVTVVVGCSENPVILDFNGLNRLSNALTRIEERLSNLIASAAALVDCNNKLHDQIIIPSHKNWIITLWHLGRDSLSEYSKEMFHCKWDIAEK